MNQKQNDMTISTTFSYW